jgi:hypothetical protein
MGVIDEVQASAEWIASALSSSGYRADFTASSLWEIERFFEDHAPGGSARPDGLLGSSVGARLFGLGGYIGEVIRRGVGGAWQVDDGDPAAEINVALILPGGTQIWPVQRVMKRFQNGSEDNVAVYGHVLGLDVGGWPS